MRESATLTAYAVICPEHLRVYLTQEEYMRQLEHANRRWECPRFVTDADPIGYCGATSEFDDENYEEWCARDGEPEAAGRES